jgi:hypothetical protein
MRWKCAPPVLAGPWWAGQQAHGSCARTRPAAVQALGLREEAVQVSCTQHENHYPAAFLPMLTLNLGSGVNVSFWNSKPPPPGTGKSRYQCRIRIHIQMVSRIRIRSAFGMWIQIDYLKIVRQSFMKYLTYLYFNVKFRIVWKISISKAKFINYISHKYFLRYIPNFFKNIEFSSTLLHYITFFLTKFCYLLWYFVYLGKLIVCSFFTGAKFC